MTTTTTTYFYNVLSGYKSKEREEEHRLRTLSMDEQIRREKEDAKLEFPLDYALDP